MCMTGLANGQPHCPLVPVHVHDQPLLDADVQVAARYRNFYYFTSSCLCWQSWGQGVCSVRDVGAACVCDSLCPVSVHRLATSACEVDVTSVRAILFSSTCCMRS